MMRYNSLKVENWVALMRGYIGTALTRQKDAENVKEAGYWSRVALALEADLIGDRPQPIILLF